MTETEKAETYAAFRKFANVPAARFEKWLETDDSKRVGWKGGGEGGLGDRSGHEIVAIRRKKKADLTDADYAHMKRATYYIARHARHAPAKNPRYSDWRYALLNWGHDPLVR